jgi:L-alanine-DL-glutamate epimerase-like enolase superfamily enzyme
VTATVQQLPSTASKGFRIVDIEATPINIPATRPERWSYGVLEGMTSIIIRIRTENGTVGIGEAVSGGPSIFSTLAAIRELAGLLDGEDATNIEVNIRRMIYEGGWHWYRQRANVVISGLEMALWDVLGKRLGAPIHQLLGGAVREELPFMYYLLRGDTPVDDLVTEAQEAVAGGFNTVYMKSLRDEEADVEILTKLREALGPSVRLRIDANEAWMPSTAVRLLRRLEPLNLEFVEQPLRVDDLEGCARLRNATAVPIALNQSAWSARTILDIIRANAADVVVTDGHQEGGIRGFGRAIDLCETAGIPVVYHAFTCLTIGMTASMQVMCTKSNCFQMGHQVAPPGFIEEDVVTERLDPANGRARVPTGPGLGLQLDEDVLKRAARRFETDGPYPLFERGAAPAWVPMV